MSDVTVTERPVGADEAMVAKSRYPRISWGAILAGTVVTLSLAWLMHLLGAAMGISLADLTDSATIEGGLDEGAIFWIVLSWLVAFFVGAMVSARLAGAIDDFSGMLHGMTMWGLATILIVMLTAYGIGALLNTGQAVLSAAASGVSATVEGVGSAAGGVGQAARQVLDTQFATTTRNILTDRAIEMTADVDPQLSEQEIRQAINGLDDRTVNRIVRDLMDDDPQSAAELLANATELSTTDAEALVDGLYREAEEQFGDPNNRQTLTQDLRGQLARQVDSYVTQFDQPGGAEVTNREVRQAIREMTTEDMQALGNAMLSGDAQQAKRVLARRTNLTSQQIDELYDGAAEQWEEEVQRYQSALNEWAEDVSDYTEMILWSAFGGTAIALVVSLGGGWLGAHYSREAYEEALGDDRRVVART